MELIQRLSSFLGMDASMALDASQWITVKPNGPEHKGQPVLIDKESGKILGGMGGKHTGKTISQVKDKQSGEESGAVSETLKPFVYSDTHKKLIGIAQKNSSEFAISLPYGETQKSFLEAKDKVKWVEDYIARIEREMPKISREDLKKMSMDEVKKLLRSNEEGYRYRMNPFLNTTSAGQFIAQALNMNDKPKIVSSTEFKNLVNEGYEPIYRGVKSQSRIDITREDIVNDFKKGERTYYGDGMYGDGIYFSNNKSTAKEYAGNHRKGLISCVLDKDKAKIINVDDLEGTLPEVEALQRGFNVIKIKRKSGETYYNVLDRGVLIVEE